MFEVGNGSLTAGFGGFGGHFDGDNRTLTHIPTRIIILIFALTLTLILTLPLTLTLTRLTPHLHLYPHHHPHLPGSLIFRVIVKVVCGDCS